jgi:hypothetical protein
LNSLSGSDENRDWLACLGSSSATIDRASVHWHILPMHSLQTLKRSAGEIIAAMDSVMSGIDVTDEQKPRQIV